GRRRLGVRPRRLAARALPAPSPPAAGPLAPAGALASRRKRRFGRTERGFRPGEGLLPCCELEPVTPAGPVLQRIAQLDRARREPGAALLHVLPAGFQRLAPLRRLACALLRCAQPVQLLTEVRRGPLQLLAGRFAPPPGIVQGRLGGLQRRLGHAYFRLERIARRVIVVRFGCGEGCERLLGLDPSRGQLLARPRPPGEAPVQLRRPGPALGLPRQ